MTAAVGATIKIAKDVLTLHRLEAAALVHNIASQRVLAKNGFQSYCIVGAYLRIFGQWQDHRIYQRSSDQLLPFLRQQKAPLSLNSEAFQSRVGPNRFGRSTAAGRLGCRHPHRDLENSWKRRNGVIGQTILTPAQGGITGDVARELPGLGRLHQPRLRDDGRENSRRRDL